MQNYDPILDDDYVNVNTNNKMTLSVMKGNLFSCDQNKLTEISSNFQCGSSNLNTAMIYWSVFFFMGVIFIYLGYSYIPKLKIKLFHEQQQQQQNNNGQEEEKKNVFEWLSLTLIYIFDISYKYINISREIALTGKLNIKIEGNNRIEVNAPYISGYLNLLFNISKLAIRITLLYLILCMSLYAILKNIPKYTTYSYQYLWMVTTAYLKGYLPMLIIQMISLYAILDTLKTLSLKHKSVFYILNDILHNNIKAKEVKKISVFRKIEKYCKFFTFQFYFKYFNVIFPMACLQIINMTVTSLVNLLYINTVLSKQIVFNPFGNELVNIKVGEELLFWVQYLLGIWKTGWTYLFVYFLPEKIQSIYPATITDKNVFVNQLYMNIFNFIVGPVLLTLFTDSNCFLYFFQGEPNMYINFIVPISSCSYTSKYVKNILFYAIQCSSTLQKYSNIMQPSFTYYNQCSSAILSNFVPVLIYSYSQVTALKLFMFIYCIVLDRYKDYLVMKKQIFMYWVHLNLKRKLAFLYKKSNYDEFSKENKSSTRVRTFTQEFTIAFDNDIKLSIVRKTNANEPQKKSDSFLINDFNIEENPMQKDNSINNYSNNSLSENRNLLKSMFIPMHRILDQDEIDEEENIFKNTRKIIIAERIKFLNNSNCCDIANLFVVLLCFGQASPFLALVIVVNIICTNLLAIISIGRYIINLAEEDINCQKKDIQESYTLLDEGCSFCIDGLTSQRTGLVIVLTTITFWSLISYDIVADVSNEKTGISIAVIIIVLMPVVVWYLTYAKHDRLLIFIRSLINNSSLDEKSLIVEENNDNNDKNLELSMINNNSLIISRL